MAEFTGLAPYVMALVPISLLGAILFYMGYKRLCCFLLLVPAQLFAFVTILSCLALLDIYQIVTGKLMAALYLITATVFVLGGATFTGFMIRVHVKSNEVTPNEGREEQ